MLRALGLMLTFLVVVACHPRSAPGSRSEPAGPSPSAGPTPAKPLDQFCGGKATAPCPTRSEHLATLRSEQCANPSPTPPSVRTCGELTMIDVDYGIVGYTRFFDRTEKLVGAIAHLYEYGQNQRFGAVPECAMNAWSAASPILCDRDAGPAIRP